MISKLNWYFWNKRRSADTCYKQSRGCPARHSCSWLLGAASLCLFRCQGVLPECRVLQRPRHRTNLPPAWEWEEENVCQQDARIRIRLLHTISITFITTGGMADECERYHSRLAELLSTKKVEDSELQCHGFAPKFHSPSWGLCCSRCKRRAPLNITNNYNDFEIDEELARFQD